LTRSEDKFKGEFRKVLFGEKQMTLAIIVLATASEAKGLYSLTISLLLWFVVINAHATEIIKPGSAAPHSQW
jgi:hypothetical protein